MNKLRPFCMEGRSFFGTKIEKCNRLKSTFPNRPARVSPPFGEELSSEFCIFDKAEKFSGVALFGRFGKYCLFSGLFLPLH